MPAIFKKTNRTGDREIMGVKKKRVEKLERNVEKKFVLFSLILLAAAAMVTLLALLGNK